MQANLSVWQENLCTNTSNGIFCAGNLNQGPAVCRRDVGGPFVCNNELSGFAIDDSGCTQEGAPGYFYSVSQDRDWISYVSKASFVMKISTNLVMIVTILNIFE